MSTLLVYHNLEVLHTARAIGCKQKADNLAINVEDISNPCAVARTVIDAAEPAPCVAEQLQRPSDGKLRQVVREKVNILLEHFKINFSG